MLTNYYCPTPDCGYSVQKMRPVVVEQLQAENAVRAARSAAQRQLPFVQQD
jgi:hypothetical protein